MPKIMEIIEKETKGKSYHTYKYSYDSIGLPSIDYDDDPNKVMKWKDSGETGSPKKPIDLKPLADQLQSVGEKPLLKYFLDGSRHVFKVDDIAYNKQVFPVVAGQIGIGCCKRENKRMSKERFYRELVLALPDKANADGWDDAAYFAAKVKKLNESEELKRLGLHFSAIIPYSTSKAGSPDTKLDNLAVGVIQDYALTQLRNYKRILSQDKVKRKFEAKGIKYYNPQFNLVIGKKPNISDEKWNWLLSHHSDLNIITYDNLLESAKKRLDTLKSLIP